MKHVWKNKAAQSLSEGFEKFVIRKEGECWDWSGCCPKNPGYPQFRSNLKLWRAHRASWILFSGEIPDGQCVLHKCDNKRCANPDHLFLGTREDNNLDMIAKGYHPTLSKKGTANPTCRLTENDVINIRELLEIGISQRIISLVFDVNQVTISLIKRNKTWSWLCPKVV